MSLRGGQAGDPRALDFGRLALQAVLAARDHGHASADGMQTRVGRDHAAWSIRTLHARPGDPPCHLALLAASPDERLPSSGFRSRKVGLHPQRGR
jgi:hypothetical protein